LFVATLLQGIVLGRSSLSKSHTVLEATVAIQKHTAQHSTAKGTCTAQHSTAQPKAHAVMQSCELQRHDRPCCTHHS